MKIQSWTKYSIFIWTSFILIQSLLPGEVSSNQSDFIVDTLHPFIQRLGIHMGVDTFSFWIRKLAHFTEYFILGVLLFVAYQSSYQKMKLYTIIFLQGLITASIDETIQLFTPNRSGELRDVLIDFLGVMFGVLFVYLIYQKVIKHKKQI
ncbi:MAG: VanZ family protein [Acholeplasma sp.]|nr:VanZ family protein [Acholeplasma sp.]